MMKLLVLLVDIGLSERIEQSETRFAMVLYTLFSKK